MASSVNHYTMEGEAVPLPPETPSQMFARKISQLDFSSLLEEEDPVKAQQQRKRPRVVEAAADVRTERAEHLQEVIQSVHRIQQLCGQMLKSKRPPFVLSRQDTPTANPAQIYGIVRRGLESAEKRLDAQINRLRTYVDGDNAFLEQVVYAGQFAPLNWRKENRTEVILPGGVVLRPGIGGETALQRMWARMIVPDLDIESAQWRAHRAHLVAIARQLRSKLPSRKGCVSVIQLDAAVAVVLVQQGPGTCRIVVRGTENVQEHVSRILAQGPE